MSSIDASDQHMTVIESTSAQDVENVALGRRKRLRKKTSDILTPPKTKQRKPTGESDSSSQAQPLNSNQSIKGRENSNPAKPPNIYVRNVNDFKKLCTNLKELVGDDNFRCRARFNDIAITSTDSDTYRKIILYLDTSGSDFHCYQLPEDKSYRVVIRHLHHSTPTDDICKELTQKGYSVKRVHNVRHPVTKAQLPLFFVDLEKTEKSKMIFREQYLQYTKIKVEEPRRRNEPVQCQNCQEFNHSRKYCHHKSKCVKCGLEHSSRDCPKSIEATPSCANCGENHTASYRGCEVYKAIKTIRNQRQRAFLREREEKQTPPPPSGTSHFPSLQTKPAPQTSSIRRPNVTYASLLSSLHKNKPSSHPAPKSHAKTQEPPSFPNPSTLPSPPKIPIPQTSVQPNQIPTLSQLQDPMSLFPVFLNKLETLLTPLINLMTTLIAQLLPKSQNVPLP